MVVNVKGCTVTVDSVTEPVLTAATVKVTISVKNAVSDSTEVTV